MSWFQEEGPLTLKAGAAINANRFVKVDTAANNQAIQCAAATDISIGVAPDGQATSGLGCKIQNHGVAKVEVGTGGVSAGVEVTSDADGKAVAWATTNSAMGVALETRAAGEIAPIALIAPSVRHA